MEQYPCCWIKSYQFIWGQKQYELDQLQIQSKNYGGTFEAHVVVLVGQLAHAGRSLLFKVERFNLAGVSGEVLQTIDRSCGREM